MVLGNSTIASIFPPLAEPLNLDLVQPASLDIRLGTEFMFARDGKKTVGEGEAILLEGGEAVQVTTLETFNLPEELSAMVKLKSSMARPPNWISLAGAEWIDPGFRGRLSLTLCNWSKTDSYLLCPGKPFAQIIFFETKGVTSGYNGRYQYSNGATEAR